MCIDISSTKSLHTISASKANTYQRSNWWDQVGGTAFTSVSAHDSILHFASYAVQSDECGTQFNWPLDDNAVYHSSGWNQAISKHRIDFSEEHKLAGHVTTQLWGMAASPFGDCLAACYSLLPKDMLLYAMSVDQTSNIIVSDEIVDLPSLWASQNSPHQPGK